MIVDIYVERYTGSNILGYGKIQIDGVLQPNGFRVVSFFKTEPIAGAFAAGFFFIISGYLINSLKKLGCEIRADKKEKIKVENSKFIAEI